MRSIIVLTCVWASLQVSTAQDTLVKSVRISLQPKAVDSQRVTIENTRDSPLVAWRIGMFDSGAARPRASQYSDFGGQDVPVRAGLGPIAPHERRVIDIAVPDSQGPWTPAVTLAAFADNYYEGAAYELAPWRESRQKRADDLAYWIRAIDMMPRESIDGVRAYLTERAVDRAGQDAGADTGLRDRMWNFGRYTGTLPNLLAAIARVRDASDRQLAALQPSLVGTMSERRVTSVALAWEPAPATKYALAIENAATVPLEAFSWEYIDERTGKPGGGGSTDMCASPPGADRGFGRVAPGEVREYFFSHEVKGGNPPPVRLRYVVFEDLSFEGSVSGRDELFRQRERWADDVGYVIGVLRRAAAEPAKAVAVLTAARAERARQLQEQGRHDATGLPQLDEFIRQAKASAVTFASNAAANEALLESQRQGYLRHLSR